jgi:tetratricopeptide (TPR) repeat protein
VFVLTGNRGEVINQWIGYTGGATALIRTMKWAVSDLTTINERVARFEISPVYNNGLFLAGFYSKIGEHLKSVEYYRRSVPLGKSTFSDYAYEIFNNMANAVWKEMIPFDSVFSTADAVLASKKVLPTKIIKTAQLMTRMGKKFNRSDDAAKYLQAGMTAALGPEENKKDPTYRGLVADYKLYIDKDTVLAIKIKKLTLGQGWEEDRDKFYDYSKWCLEREINLEEAEAYARKAINMVYPGKFRARVYNTVADICFIRGKTEEAIRMINLAIDEDPDNRLYQNQLIKFQDAK